MRGKIRIFLLILVHEVLSYIYLSGEIASTYGKIEGYVQYISSEGDMLYLCSILLTGNVEQLFNADIRVFLLFNCAFSLKQ